MKNLLVVLIALFATTAGAAPADDAKPARTAALVDASREAKAKRKTSTTRVITNSDVKKSKGVLIENKRAATPIVAGPKAVTIEEYEASKKAAAEAEAVLRAAQEHVASLEKELAGVEQKYYEENDLDRRDTAIVREFSDVSARLLAARKELEALTPAPSDN